MLKNIIHRKIPLGFSMISECVRVPVTRFENYCPVLGLWAFWSRLDTFNMWTICWVQSCKDLSGKGRERAPLWFLGMQDSSFLDQASMEHSVTGLAQLVGLLRVQWQPAWAAQEEHSLDALAAHALRSTQLTCVQGVADKLNTHSHPCWPPTPSQEAIQLIDILGNLCNWGRTWGTGGSQGQTTGIQETDLGSSIFRENPSSVDWRGPLSFWKSLTLTWYDLEKPAFIYFSTKIKHLLLTLLSTLKRTTSQGCFMNWGPCAMCSSLDLLKNPHPWIGDIAQEVEYLPSKLKALNWNFPYWKRKQ
jgi:hypothetical protein